MNHVVLNVFNVYKVMECQVSIASSNKFPEFLASLSIAMAFRENFVSRKFRE